MAETRYLKVGEHRMAALSFNEALSGTPLVFLHGITSSPAFWVFGQTSYVKECRRWYSLSLPGHYPAAFPNGFHKAALTAELIADVTAAAIRQLTEGEPAIIAGHSTGAFAALAVAARAPELATGVISVSGFARGYWTGALRLLQVFARHGGVIGETLFKANFQFLRASPQGFWQAMRLYAADANALYSDPALPSTMQLLYDDLQGLSPDAMLAYFRCMPDIDISAWLPAITAQTLVITGDRDPIVQPEQSRKIARLIPNSQLHLLKGAGHVPMAERREEYHRLITAWLQVFV
jgi:pimeloyl-ACP methyl ester carboxylesterase